MHHTTLQLPTKQADAYEISLGPVNLVMVVTDQGLVGCGALDIPALDKFQIAGARVSGVSTIDDLLAAEINLINETARKLGLNEGMTGKNALELL